MEQINRELVSLIGAIEWEFQKRLWKHGVENVTVRPKIRRYNGQVFGTYDIYVKASDGELSRIRVMPNFRKNVVEITIRNKPALIRTIEEADKSWELCL